MADNYTAWLVQLHLASALQQLPINDRWSLATALTSHNTYAKDPVLPLMVWYGINPAIPENRTEAVKLIAKCKIPKVRQFIARRLANKEDNTKDKVGNYLLYLFSWLTNGNWISEKQWIRQEDRLAVGF